jgi:hypothetical protein
MVQTSTEETGMTDVTTQTADLIAEIASLRDKLAQARNLADAMLNGVQDHYTSMSDVRSDLWILQDILKD